VKMTKHELFVNKDSSQKKLLLFMWLEEPHQITEQAVERSMEDGSFQDSKEFANAKYGGCFFVTGNIDKGGDDMVVSIRNMNREGGNSMMHTYPIASIGGPVSECYKNKADTIFAPGCPTGPFLQGLVDDAYQMLAIHTPHNECRSILFKPTPGEAPCTRRKIGVEMLPDSMDESKVNFDSSVSESGGVPEVPIPHGTESISVRLIVSRRKGVDVAVGAQLIADSPCAASR